MKLEYEIPTHLESFLANKTTEELQSLLTLLFEVAIRHRLIDYPKLEIERGVEGVVRGVGFLTDISKDFFNTQAVTNDLVAAKLSRVLELLEEGSFSKKSPPTPEVEMTPTSVTSVLHDLDLDDLEDIMR